MLTSSLSLFCNLLRYHSFEMAACGAANAELLEFPKKDKRRFLHVVYRVGDLDKTIKYAHGNLSLLLICDPTSKC